MNKSQIPAAQKEVLSLLLDDHKKAKKLFKEFEAEKDDAAKEKIAQEVCTELTVHAAIEEEIFYPFLRDQKPELFGDLLNEALVEHASAKDLIAQIQAASMEDDLYEAKVTVLGEYIAHHVTEEEDELFPKVISQKIDLREIAAAMAERKEEMLQSALPA
ncbi:hemerythrin domain-containing protein [Alcaligenaceae bacterium]|nr:hemerythrin domain-containing protein [Alcaligenaceae bacterium]